jgi:hypothetical protein
MNLDRETAGDNFHPEEVAVSDKWRSQFRGHIFTGRRVQVISLLGSCKTGSS